MRWIRWYSIKHTDGRRASGVGYNESKWHLMTDGTVRGGDWKVACGRQVQIARGETGVEFGQPPAEACKACQRIAERKACETSES